MLLQCIILLHGHTFKCLLEIINIFSLSMFEKAAPVIEDMKHPAETTRMEALLMFFPINLCLSIEQLLNEELGGLIGMARNVGIQVSGAHHSLREQK
jgi:hypothetical protein